MTIGYVARRIGIFFLIVITAVTLNLFLNGGRRSADAEAIEPALAH